ncbi:MAG: hypothetical protein KatS3mg060_1164 [Dehalococcoidia bacterium]|nr:MAG: hypothetical protein KatS3mg060_1164 [Dehalococcoidia bacterium]
MVERSTVLQFVQIAAETTPGTTPGTGFRKLQSLRFEVQPEGDFQIHRGAPYKFPSLAILNKESASVRIPDSPATYNELPYLLASVLKTTTPTVPDGATDARLWTFDPSSTAADTPRTFSIEQGDAVRAHRVAYALFHELSLKFSREAATVAATGFARPLQDGITLTSGATEVPLVPIMPHTLDGYLDPTHGALGTTKLLRLFSGELTVRSRWQAVWTVNSAAASFAAHYETEPEGRLTLLVEADAQGMAHLTQARGGATQFFRLRAVGPQIETGQNHELTIDLAVKVSKLGSLQDEDGLFVCNVEFVIVHDAGWGRALQAVVKNTLTGL